MFHTQVRRSILMGRKSELDETQNYVHVSDNKIGESKEHEHKYPFQTLQC